MIRILLTVSYFVFKVVVGEMALQLFVLSSIYNLQGLKNNKVIFNLQLFDPFY